LLFALIDQVTEGVHINRPQLSGKLIEITSHFGVGSKQVNDEQQREKSEYNENQWGQHYPPALQLVVQTFQISVISKTISLNLANCLDKKSHIARLNWHGPHRAKQISAIPPIFPKRETDLNTTPSPTPQSWERRKTLTQY
jgi:hypothetical protein